MAAATLEGPSFLAFVVEDVVETAAFLETVAGLTRSAHSPPGAVVFDTKPIACAVRSARPHEVAGEARGVAAWFALAGDVDTYRAAIVEGGASATEVSDGPFGRMFVLAVPGGFSLVVHAAQS